MLSQQNETVQPLVWQPSWWHHGTEPAWKMLRLILCQGTGRGLLGMGTLGQRVLGVPYMLGFPGATCPWVPEVPTKKGGNTHPVPMLSILFPATESSGDVAQPQASRDLENELQRLGWDAPAVLSMLFLLQSQWHSRHY